MVDIEALAAALRRLEQAMAWQRDNPAPSAEEYGHWLTLGPMGDSVDAPPAVREISAMRSKDRETLGLLATFADGGAVIRANDLCRSSMDPSGANFARDWLDAVIALDWRLQ